ncbi:MAG TPA: acetyl-CoA carboxylase biotin carboxylase subunit [Saprospiraceae bacterium]|nr:acetyl-CoA carboxylase biotin carboxylase subunit [Saprospiraceae bacterium]HQW56210.1 acetyl-CoA carboxylase biotin carboxylase subunit [Saprospiraceae bacterium]
MKKILVANRGEIAVRVMRTCKKLGIKTVAVYSEIDSKSLHALYADEAYCIGDNAPSKSYLDMDKIIEVALRSGADGIHPGYGFLSENSQFCKAVKDAGLIFIGPDEHAIDVMGNKLAAKEAVRHYNIPMVPGSGKAITDVQDAIRMAEEIGYPVLIKAAAGGGGKGMRVVEDSPSFIESFERATNEALSSFKDGSVFIEKYVTKPRHIEIQIIADQFGNICYLFERECSIQRRHQKVIEEAPSAIVSSAMRKAMGEAAVNVARACNYTNAGTVEFLVDEKLNFYFLEMNTRLQVEHPVTEEISGLDMVELQISIALGKSLPFSQDDLKIHGHSMELRVYAEDPYNQFLPDIGTLQVYQEPTGEHIRVDSGFKAGDAVSVFYDPMISKLTVWGLDRASCIAKMKAAINEYEIIGVKTTLPFGLFVMNHEAFASGNFDTSFVPKYFTTDIMDQEDDNNAMIAALISNQLHLSNGKEDYVLKNRRSRWMARKQ